MKNKIDIPFLLKTASKAGLKSYSPYSKFRVGAALLSENGKIFSGTNIENRSYGATICAERTAVTKAVSEGQNKFSAICIVGLDSDEILSPCGMCRQVLSEFSNDMTVIMANKKMDYQISNIRDLFPFDALKDLKNR